MQQEEGERFPLSRTERRAKLKSEGTKGGLLQFVKELPVLIVVALAIALLIKTFILQAFFIPSQSMENTLLIGDRVLVSKFNYRFGEPEQGDVVVFVSPTGEESPQLDRGPIGNFFNSVAEGLGLRSSEKDFIKRVIATGGQTVEGKDGAVFVDGKKLNEPYRRDQAPIPEFGAVKVPADRIFVMGDNRNNSQDSRVFGPIKKTSIVGRAFVLIWPPGRMEILGKP